MKKYIALFALATLVLTSCGSTPESTPPTDVVPKQEKDIGKSNPIPEVKEQAVANSGDTAEKLNTTMKEIFKSGKTATCTFKISNEGVTFDGIMYIDGKKIRYTMNGEVMGNKMENNAIMKDGYSYSWTNMSKDGFKMKEDIGEEDANNKDSGAEMEAEEMNQKVEFECKKGADSSKFDLPTGINFQDMGALPQMPKGN